MFSPGRTRVAGLVVASLLTALALAPAAAAHSGIEVGEYVLEIGWRNEPANLGQPNAIQVTITNHETDEPIVDLPAEALSVVVSIAGIDGPNLALEPAFDAAARTGPLGEYDAELVPAAVGDYTLHVTGSIHGTPVDVKVAAVVEVEAATEPPSPDLVLQGGGVAILLVLGGMTFLLVRVRPGRQP